MTESRAWMTQVNSDFAAMNRVLDLTDDSTFCQAIAKCQQVVEKSINAIDAALREKGVIFGRARAEHYPERMLNRLARLPRSRESELPDKIAITLRRWWPDIRDLCMLAPHLPEPGELYAKNTEYPFNKRDGTWTAPAAPGSFSLEEVDRYMLLAKSFRYEAQRIITAAHR